TTMPETTLLAVADHARITGDTISGTITQAREVFARLAEVGVDLTDVFQVLEDKGIGTFEKSWLELLDTVAERLVKVSA
ncbi:transaldolase family protein, partial [Nonomuraea sp. NPDC050153]|uniref:transaldolase family protein n=1 Tax=Nonomuraea sp. NPDC050153 TaxID=3364359 RepID=UPI00379DE34E